ncbi:MULTISPECIES: phosphoethanolamine transferase [unclassified Psychrobacter]|jgi:lipid A ethanolaminephosphotransferase|uniref:phosphoethanolamine transferase n=1 Tax=Psychrobacter TaxID=497 RepID=UPI0003F8BB4F|nr:MULTISPECIES: phosphoethanolamine--lipid A transferase [unclassified Psychrobacter]|tara:strand:+ start:2202 stop:3872 length:1671 start_codon:yes stop_codon:yes gene_type:complete
MLPSQALSTISNQANTKKSFASKIFDRKINLSFLIIIVVLYLIATANIGFFTQVLSVYPLSTNIGFIVSLSGLLFSLMWLIVQLLCYRPIAKPVLIALVLIAAVCGYFTDAYGTIFDTNMLINSLQTDQAEAMELMSLSFFIRLLILGVVPAVIISKLKIKPTSLRRSILQKTATLIAAIALVGVCLLPFGDQYATFFRQHKMVRSYTNPITPIYSVIKLGTDYIDELRRPDTMILHATDAKRNAANGSTAKPKLMVFVVGETVRADHISLNGYKRDTMPLLAKQSNIYSFKNATSCGTSTAYSVPCMFSYANRSDYNPDEADYNENVLDTLNKQGVNVIWRDNNSSSKGVADRVTFEDYKTSDINPNCDDECRDIGMLDGFDKLVKTGASAKDTLILLHQMGNHGPAYYKRYPKAFEEYKPVCMTNELSKCDDQSVINGYDNAIRYTDYFLNNVIDTLKTYEPDYDVVMVYISDHGESLGENNIYLHGLPYSIAPAAQKQVPVIIWSPTNNSIDKNSLMLDKPVSHDFITPTLLQFFGITTDEMLSKPTFFQYTH